MSNTKLNQLKKAKKKLEEETGPLGDGKVTGMTGVAKGGGPEANKGFGSGQSVGVSAKDANSAPVKKVGREMGVDATGVPQEFSPDNPEMKGETATVQKVSRKEGAAAGVQEVGKGDKEGTDSEVDGANKVPRENGSAAGAKEVGEYGDMSSFRSKVRSAFGLSLDDKMNKGNDGLNK